MTNEVLQTIKSRRTVRAYRPDAVPEELLQAVLEAGTYAPTGRGRQSPTIIAVTSEGYRQKISELNAAVLGSDSDPYYGAPVIILVLADGTANTFVEDGSCVLENMMLAAASLGLGSVWVQRAGDLRQRRGQGAFTGVGPSGNAAGRRQYRAGLSGGRHSRSGKKKGRLHRPRIRTKNIPRAAAWGIFLPFFGRIGDFTWILHEDAFSFYLPAVFCEL